MAKKKKSAQEIARKNEIGRALTSLGMTKRHYGWSELCTYANLECRQLTGSELVRALSVHPKLKNGLARAAKGEFIPLPAIELKKLSAKQKVNMVWTEKIRSMPLQTPGKRRNPATELAWEKARIRTNAQASAPKYKPTIPPHLLSAEIKAELYSLQTSQDEYKPTIIPHQVAAEIKTGLPGVQSTQTENPKRYDTVGLAIAPKAMLDKNGIEEFLRMHVPASQQREAALYIHKHQHEASTAIELAQRYLDELAEQQSIREAEAEKLADVVPELVADDPIIMPPEVVAVVVEEKPAPAPAPQLGQPAKLHSDRTAQRTVEQRDATAHNQFVEWVWENFAGRCAVTGWRNGYRLQAAHIEPATSGNFSADNGLLLTPSMHDLMDHGLMAVNPVTMTVHFAPGVELGAMFEGKLIVPKLWPLNVSALEKRWEGRKFS